VVKAVIIDAAELADRPDGWTVAGRRRLAEGAVSSFVEERVLTPDDVALDRQFVQHPGAVAVIAVDEQDRVALVRQYRHPVRHRLIEPPAGLLDVDGEDYLAGAERELAEEAGLAATDWRVLVDYFASPGAMTEGLRIYLARGLSATEPPDGFELHGEEAHMDVVWAGVEDLVDAIVAGRLFSPTLVAGVLALWAARTRDGLDALRPADAAWPAREQMLAQQARDRA
jgi:8-oxo-dGDP phosphatase